MGIFARLTGKEFYIQQLAEKFNLASLVDAHQAGRWTQLTGDQVETPIADYETLSVDYKPCQLSCINWKKTGWPSELKNGFTIAVVNNENREDLISLTYKEETPGYYKIDGISSCLSRAKTENLALLCQESGQSPISKILQAANNHRKYF